MTTAVGLVQSTLTPEQIEIRRSGIGASEIAAVLGLHHRLTPLDIWMQKRGMAEPQLDTRLLKMGRIMEGVIVGLYEEEVARPQEKLLISKVGTKVHPNEQWMLCTPNAVVTTRNADRWQWGLECKNRDAYWRDQDGESGTEILPRRRSRAVSLVDGRDRARSVGHCRVVRRERLPHIHGASEPRRASESRRSNDGS
jgi:predicted phage-related endonuclease